MYSKVIKYATLRTKKKKKKSTLGIVGVYHLLFFVNCEVKICLKKVSTSPLLLKIDYFSQESYHLYYYKIIRS